MLIQDCKQSLPKPKTQSPKPKTQKDWCVRGTPTSIDPPPIPPENTEMLERTTKFVTNYLELLEVGSTFKDPSRPDVERALCLEQAPNLSVSISLSLSHTHTPPRPTPLLLFPSLSLSLALALSLSLCLCCGLMLEQAQLK